MKIGTDAVLLGAWTNVPPSGKILDVGTGSGILALMMAQRSLAWIDAVEIDRDAAGQARQNAAASPWKERIRIYTSAFQEFMIENKEQYDLIICNPPYFVRSLKAPDPARRVSRHDETLPANELLQGAATLLRDSGRLALIFPADALKSWLLEAALTGFYPVRTCTVFSREGKPSTRVMAEFSREANPAQESGNLMIRYKDGRYTEEYIELTKEFYLGLK